MQTESPSLRISKAELRALRAKAREERVSQGSIVRRALRAYGVTPEPDPGRRGYDVIRHVVGKNRGGAKDLSTNRKRLAAYGT